MNQSIKQGATFLDLKNDNQERKIQRVTLQGVHLVGISNPLPLLTVIRYVKEKTWIAK